MKRLFAVAICVFGFSVQAKMYEPVFQGKMPTLLTYQEVAGLPPYKRIEYIQEIRDLLIEMEMDGLQRSAGNNEFHEAIAALLHNFSVVQEAEAAAPIVPTYQNGKWSCPADYGFDSRVGTCILKEAAFYTAGECANHQEVASPDYNNGTRCLFKSCVACIPQDSWNALPQERQDQLNRARKYAPRQGQNPSEVWHKPGTFDGKSEDETRKLVLKDPKAPQADIEGDRGGGSSSNGVTQTAGEGKPPVPKKDADGVVKCQELWTKNPKKKYSQERQRAALDKHLKDFAGHPSCLVGGDFSQYKDHKVIKGKCQAVTEFPSGTNSPHAVKCSKKGESMCNPLLFCMKKGKDGKASPICKKLAMDLTWKCDQDPDTKNCDPFDDKSGLPTGAQESWDKFKTGFEAMCVPNTAFVQYYCIECMKMSDRFAEIDKKVAARKSAAPKASEPVQPPATTD